MTVPKTVDLVVIGSGITGAATGAAAAARGASVLVIDKEDGPAREGSGRAQGSLRLQGRHVAEFPLAQEALRRWEEAAAEADGGAGGIELRRGGNLYLATDEAELPTLKKLVAQAHEAGLHEVQLLDPAELRRLVPGATGPVLAAMYSPVDMQCQPDKGTRLFIDRAERAGATFRYGIKATAVLERGGAITAVDTTAGRVEAGAVVLAAGIWTPYLARTVGLKVPIMPVCLTELETQPIAPLFDPTVRAFGFGSRQRPDGRLVVSGGLNARITHHVTLYDFNGLRYWLPRAISFRKNLTLRADLRQVLRQLRATSTLHTALVPHTSPEPRPLRRSVDDALSALAKIFPAAEAARPMRYWGGMIDMTPDGLPIIDHRSGPRGLTIITGLAGHGLAIGPVLGEIAADLALDGHTRRAIETFSLARFTKGPVRQPEMMI